MSVFRLREKPISSITTLLSRRFLLTAVGFLAVFQISVYWLTGMVSSTDGSMPLPQPDTLLYCQAARRVVEGHPFSYSRGEKPSTGTTSVIYPFVLAIPHALGAKGTSLLTAGFWLNAVFYLLFLFGWVLAFEVWMVDRWKVLLAGVLLALSGQPAYAALSQSDIGLTLAVTGLLSAGLAMGKAWCWGSLLVALPWVRPEGMMCAVAVLSTQIGRTILARQGWCIKPKPSDWVLALLAVVSAAGVFAFNAWLTGMAQFSSVASKGYFVQMPFMTAVYHTTKDLVLMFRTYVFGLESGDFRDMVAIPLVSGLAFWWGVLSYRWRSNCRWGMMAMTMAMGLSFLSVASSGWQGSNSDRYLAWIVPMIVLFVAGGAVAAARCFGSTAKTLIPLGFVGYGLLMAVMAVSAFRTQTLYSDHFSQFAQQASRLLPAEASVGGATCNMAYFMGDRRFFHFYGIYTPDLFCKDRIDSAETVERLCHCRNLRPDYLITSRPDPVLEFEEKDISQFARSIFSGPNGFELRMTDWRIFDSSLVAPEAPTGCVLQASVDVGYEADERARQFVVVDRWNRLPGAPFVRIGKSRGREIVECGRAVVGTVEMSIPLKPGRDAVLVVRSAKNLTAAFHDGAFNQTTEFEMDVRHPAFNVTVDGVETFHRHVEEMDPGEKDDVFVEFRLTIPGYAFTRSESRISLEGDHAPCCYWFYQ